MQMKKMQERQLRWRELINAKTTINDQEGIQPTNRWTERRSSKRRRELEKDDKKAKATFLSLIKTKD